MDPFTQGMALVRFLSAAIELAGAIMMLRLGRLESAVRVNALLGLIGPLVLVVTMSIGLIGLANRVSAGKLLLIFAGVCLILLGTRR